MKFYLSILFSILLYSESLGQVNTQLLESLMKQRPDQFAEILNNPNEFRVQLFYTQIDRDEIKRQKCREQGITLIAVPEVRRRLKINDLVPFILSEFDKYNIPYPESAKSFQIDWTEFNAQYKN